MDYFKEMYGDRNPEFIEGFLAAMDTYAIHMDGKRYIGSPEKEVKGEMKRAIVGMGGDPQHKKWQWYI